MTEGMFRKDFIIKKDKITKFNPAPDYRKQCVMFYMDSKMSCN